MKRFELFICVQFFYVFVFDIGQTGKLNDGNMQVINCGTIQP